MRSPVTDRARHGGGELLSTRTSDSKRLPSRIQGVVSAGALRHAPFAPDSLNASFEGSLSGSFSRGSFIRGGPRSSGSGDGDGEGSGDVGGSNDSSHSGRSGKGCSFPEEGGSYSRRRDSDEK